MSIGLLFWIIFIVALLFGGYSNRSTMRIWLANDLVLFALLGLLGYAIFGSPVHK